MPKLIGMLKELSIDIGALMSPDWAEANPWWSPIGIHKGLPHRLFNNAIINPHRLPLCDGLDQFFHDVLCVGSMTSYVLRS